MDRTNKYKSLFSTAAIFAISNVLSKLVLSLLLPLYTRMLTTAQYGTAELLTTISQLVVPLCSLAIQDSVFRFSMDSKQNPGNVLRNALKVASFSSCALMLLAVAFNWYEALSEWKVYFAIISILSMFRAIFSLYANATHRTMVYSIDSVLYNSALAVSNVIYLVVFKLGLGGYFLAMITAEVISIAFLFIKCGLWKELKASGKDPELLKDMLRYSAPLILNSISWGLTHVVDKVMLEQYADSASVGLYSAASKIPSLLSVVLSVFSSAWTLSVVRDYEAEKDIAFYKSIFDLQHVGCVFCAAGILLVNNRVFPWILGDSFAESTVYVPTLLIGTVFLSYTNYFSSIFSAMKQSKLIMYSALIGCAVNVVFNYMLIPKIGIHGACIATAFSYVVIAVMRTFFCEKHFSIGIGYGKWIFSLVILVALAAAVAVSFYAEICAVVVLAVYTVMYWKELKSMVGMLLSIVKRKGKNA
ncbi:MAG: polysaccharide biosynthesis C-terminal domain-containing protein [Clostridia bacterium]|nr:polysaccharide biosynthesis C-terminal domain-containing protein [Clostridia bacterium]